MINVEIVRYKDFREQINSIRYEVFVKEQNVPLELELDGLDDKAVHALVLDGDTVVGTGRLLEDGHIGRVCVKQSHRFKGIGERIMEGLLETAQNSGMSEVFLAAQCRAKDFYRNLGFSEQGGVYLDAGIDHIDMKKRL